MHQTSDSTPLGFWMDCSEPRCILFGVEFVAIVDLYEIQMGQGRTQLDDFAFDLPGRASESGVLSTSPNLKRPAKALASRLNASCAVASALNEVI